MKLTKEQKRVVAGVLGEILIARLRECWRADEPATLPSGKKLKKLAKDAGLALRAGIAKCGGR